MPGMPFKKLGRRIYLAQDLTHRLQKEHSGEEVGGGRGGKACGLALLAGERTGRARAHAAHPPHTWARRSSYAYARLGCVPTIKLATGPGKR